ncbi:stress protein DDR48-like isoform X2 [Frieseomelitta varia]|uniref:stress protein DDR48-like isoform X2 n=1 Tax=Frieseomelitta varia TaxID=561572 RepID=UPI001CB6ABC4|nr:stress protein DDR48-like isoform X2 [Frieseomelitta varia]
MSFFISYIVFFFFIQCSFCASDLHAVQNNEQSTRSLLNVQKKIDAEHAIFDEEKKSNEGSSIYNKELGFKERKRDEKRYGNQDTARKGHDKGRHSSGESEVVDHEKNAFEQHGSGYYKKGHHRTGFSNNYHKDESGNNSSFYEDSDNEGGHRSSGNTDGYYGQKLQNSFRDGSRDASYFEKDKAQRGLYDNSKIGYNNDRYINDRKNYLRNEAEHYFDKNNEDVYNHKERHYSIPYRSNDRVPLFGYLRHYVDTLPGSYYREDPYMKPYSKDYRYFPYRQRDYEQETYYPYRGVYTRSNRDDFYDNRYLEKYRNGFDNRYH